MKHRLVLLFFFVSLGCGVLVHAKEEKPAGPSDILIVAGTVLDAHGKGVKDVAISFFVDGKKWEPGEEVTTSVSGRYEAELVFPRGTLPGTRVEIEICKPCFQNSARTTLEKVVRERVTPEGNIYYLAHHSFNMARAITPAFWIASIVLLAVYVVIALEFMHRTLAALLGAAILLTVTYTAGTFNPDYVIIPFEDAIHAIDMNVIFLLMAMMIIVGVLRKTGVFQWMAYKSYQLARGNVYVLAVILMFVTAVLSAFLDNVTTMLLIIPVTIEISLTLGINPIALLIPEVFASNVGGTVTLIGDPPNILIGSYAKLSFLEFVRNLTAVNSVVFVVAVVYFVCWYRKDYMKARVDNIQELIEHLRAEYRITNKTLLVQGGIILGITIFLFIVHGVLNMEPSIAALTGAAMLMAISRVDVVEMLEHEIEWPTLIFFMMLFVVVAGAEQTGLIQLIADWVKDISRGSLTVAILMILWVAALASAIVDNIPFTATMLPIVSYLTATIPGAESGILWWALSLGACLGGNGTMIGASANVVTVGMAERAGYPISFMAYIRAAFLPMLVSIAICSVWLLVFE